MVGYIRVRFRVRFSSLMPIYMLLWRHINFARSEELIKFWKVRVRAADSPAVG